MSLKKVVNNYIGTIIIVHMNHAVFLIGFHS